MNTVYIVEVDSGTDEYIPVSVHKTREGARNCLGTFKGLKRITEIALEE